MISLTFDGLGTHWQILINQEEIPFDLFSLVKEMVAQFEQQYSRFLPESEVGLIGRSKKMKLTVSPDLANMLRFGLVLNKLTDGAFDLNIAAMLEDYGYDSDYSFVKKEPTDHLGDFELSGKILIKRGMVKLDLGAVGKGYLIDLIAKFLQQKGITSFLINGGGDIYATTKADDQPWQAAIEHPAYPDRAVGIVELRNQALATSSPQKRKYRDFHHILNFQTKQPVETVLSVSVLARSAMVADGAATAMFVSSCGLREKMVEELGIGYLAIYPDMTFEKNTGFPDVFQEIA